MTAVADSGDGVVVDMVNRVAVDIVDDVVVGDGGWG